MKANIIGEINPSQWLSDHAYRNLIGVTSYVCLQAEDRISLVQAVLDSRPGCYQDQATLTSLVALLGLTHRQSDLQLKTAYAALREGDEEFARLQCMELIRCGVKDAWPLASQLASLRTTMDLNAEDAKILLGFAMAHCPRDKVGHAWSILIRKDWHGILGTQKSMTHCAALQVYCVLYIWQGQQGWGNNCR